MTDRALSRDELRDLGFPHLTPADARDVAWPTPEHGDALGREVAAPLALSACLSFAFGSAAQDLSQDSGLDLGLCRERPGVVRVTLLASEGALEIRPRSPLPAVAGAPVYYPPEEGGVALIDTARMPDFIVASSAGGLHVTAYGDHLHVVALRPAGDLLVEPLADFGAPVATWLEALDDEWLRQEVAATLRHPSSWSHTVAAGLLTRLVEARDPHAALARFFRGDIDPVHAGPRQWARHLSLAQIRTLQRLSLAEIDVLHRAIEELREAVDDGEAGWTGDWRHLCRRRDDLECVRLLLHEAGADAPVAESLLDLDRQGELLRLSIPWTADLADERARRVGRLDPYAWWGACELAGDRP